MSVAHKSARRVCYLVSHAIQYQAPMLRKLAQRSELELDVAFLSDASTRKHYDPGFATSFEWDVPLTDGYACRFLSSAPKVDFWHPFLPDVWSRIDGGRCDALWLHGWNQSTQLLAIAQAVRYDVPVLLRGESKPEGRRGPVHRTVLKALLRRAAACLAIGTENRAFYREFGVENERLFSVPYGVDNEHFESGARSAGATRAVTMMELGLDPSRPVVLFASKLIDRKRPLDLVEAYRRLSIDGTEPRAQLLIVGEGPERTNLEASIRETGWGSIHLAGFRNQSELPALYDLCDVFVLPSSYETWGLVVNEAMCAGRPVIASRGVGSVFDLIDEGETGFSYEVGDVDALSAQLRTLLDDPERARLMGERARQRVEGYGIEAACSGVLEAVAEVCAS